MKTITSQHHKKLKLNISIPAWLWFPLYNSKPREKWTEEKEKVAQIIKKNLKEHLRQNGLDYKGITEPNLYDCGGEPYTGGENHEFECNKLSTD